MDLTKKQANTEVAEVRPDHVDDSSAGRRESTKTESTLVTQQGVDEKNVKSSIEALPDQGPPQNTTPETPPEEEKHQQQTGKLKSWRGGLILLVTGGAMFMDNVFTTSTNISLSAIEQEFNVESADLQWMISAYTLSFGGFLLLSGVLSDRYGRKPMLIGGLVWLSIWTLVLGFGSSFIEIAVFRGMQGIGAALTIPSAVGIISSFFTGQDRTRALGLFAASGAVGFTAGLVLGGLLSSYLGWRYIFRLSVIVSGLLAILAVVVLPNNHSDDNKKTKLDYFGASLSTCGLILISFVVSGGGVYGWGSPLIIVLLIVSVGLLIGFVFWEHRASNPIMPLSLWKIHNFPSIWIVGFTANGSYIATLYYTVLMSQQVDHLSPLDTAIRFIPSGVLGFVITLITTRSIEFIDGKYVMITGLCFSVLAPVPSCLLAEHTTNFWANILPTSFISISGISIGYITASTLMLISAPMSAKSLCGGMINTAYQIGGGVTLAICSAVVQELDVDKGHSLTQQYQTGLWCTSGVAGVGLIVAVLFLKNDHTASHSARESNNMRAEVLEHMA